MIERFINHEIERKEQQSFNVSLVDYQTFTADECGCAFRKRGEGDYDDSIFLATVMHSGPRMIRIVSMISCVLRSSTISSFT